MQRRRARRSRAQGAGGCRREDPGGAQGQGGAQGGRGAQGEAAAVKVQAVHRRRRRARRRGAQGAGGCRREDPGGAGRRGDARKEVEERKEQEAAAVKIRCRRARNRGQGGAARSRCTARRRARSEERKEQEAAAVKIQAVHRGKAARKEVEERKEQEAAAVKIQAVHRGKAARKDLSARHPSKPSSPSTVHRSFIDATDADDSKAFGVAGHVLSLARLGASTSESRVSASCKKLGIDPAAVAAQLAAFPRRRLRFAPIRRPTPTPPPSRVSCCSRTVRCPSAFVPSLSLRLATRDGIRGGVGALKLPAAPPRSSHSNEGRGVGACGSSSSHPRRPSAPQRAR